MTKPAFSTIDSKDLVTASGGTAIDVPPGRDSRDPWGPIIGKPGGTPPYFPRPTPTFPGPTFPVPTGPVSPTGTPWEGMSSHSAARTRIEQ